MIGVGFQRVLLGACTPESASGRGLIPIVNWCRVRAIVSYSGCVYSCEYAVWGG